jgi:hypothetical protein
MCGKLSPYKGWTEISNHQRFLLKTKMFQPKTNSNLLKAVLDPQISSQRNHKYLLKNSKE